MASGLSTPACPPARPFTQMSPSTSCSSAFSAHARVVTSWWTTPPAAWTFCTTQRGLPSAVTKKRTPSSRATSTQRRMRSS
ncbi:MAG: hypothetical protein M5U28_45575 [Sandaracinaceae bacterium]|nr:hypothetical protein [Sandaracinaceae bacterium]